MTRTFLAPPIAPLFAAVLLALTQSAVVSATDGGAPASTKTSLDAVIARTLAAYGGEKRLGAVKAVVQQGKVASVARPGKTGDTQRVFESPDKLRVEVTYPGEKREVRLGVGLRGWRDGVEVEGPARDAVLLQTARMALPLLLQQRRAQVTELGVVEREGKKLRALEVALEGALGLTVFIDDASGLIVRSVGHGPQGLQFVAEYRDFRKVQGLLFPFGETTYAMGAKTSEIALEKVELPAHAPPGTFAAPGSP